MWERWDFTVAVLTTSGRRSPGWKALGQEVEHLPLLDGQRVAGRRHVRCLRCRAHQDGEGGGGQDPFAGGDLADGRLQLVGRGQPGEDGVGPRRKHRPHLPGLADREQGQDPQIGVGLLGFGHEVGQSGVGRAAGDEEVGASRPQPHHPVGRAGRLADHLDPEVPQHAGHALPVESPLVDDHGLEVGQGGRGRGGRGGSSDDKIGWTAVQFERSLGILSDTATSIRLCLSSPIERWRAFRVIPWDGLRGP